jgi:hypothetical protein
LVVWAFDVHIEKWPQKIIFELYTDAGVLKVLKLGLMRFALSPDAWSRTPVRSSVSCLPGDRVGAAISMRMGKSGIGS